MQQRPFTPEMISQLREIVLRRAPAALDCLAHSQSDDEVFDSLPSAAVAAFHLDQYAEAKQYAERALTLAPGYRDTWNYGNAVHLGHTILGLLAREEGDLPKAIFELLASADHQGSPQLKSFGPTMQLARALLQDGQVAPVLDYLKRCRVFWEMGGEWLDIWERKIQAGQIPNFCFRSHA